MLTGLKNEKSPAARVPIAMALISTGMMFIVFGILWPRFISLAPYAGTNLNDFLRGLLYGLGISLEIGGLVLAVAAREKQL